MEDKKKKVTKKEEKKETKKKVTPKKEVKKEVKKEKKEVVKKEKTAVPNAEPFGEKFKRFVSSYKFLYAAFGILLVIVILLAVMVFVKGNEASKNRSNIVFSIIDKDTHNYIDLDLATLVGNEYSLKIANFRRNQLNGDGAVYSIIVTNDSAAEIEILKGDDLENLMTDQQHTVIEGGPLSKTEKEEVVYRFRVKDGSSVKEGEKLRIEVDS